MTWHKVADLEGALLDAAVAKTLRTSSPDLVHPYSTDEAYAEPIIKHSRIHTMRLINGDWLASIEGSIFGMVGRTRFIAATRAYVASIHGETIELP